MARINLWDEQYPVPAEIQRTKTLTARQCPDLALTLRQMDEIVTGQCVDRGQSYIATYVDGEDGNPPLLLPLPHLGAVQLSRYLCNTIAALQSMQVPDPGDEPYSLSDWLIIAKRYRGLWRAALAFMAEIQGAESADYDAEGNSSTPGTGGSCRPGVKTSTPTPN